MSSMALGIARARQKGTGLSVALGKATSLENIVLLDSSVSGTLTTSGGELLAWTDAISGASRATPASTKEPVVTADSNGGGSFLELKSGDNFTLNCGRNEPLFTNKALRISWVGRARATAGRTGNANLLFHPSFEVRFSSNSIVVILQRVTTDTQYTFANAVFDDYQAGWELTINSDYTISLKRDGAAVSGVQDAAGSGALIVSTQPIRVGASDAAGSNSCAFDLKMIQIYRGGTSRQEYVQNDHLLDRAWPSVSGGNLVADPDGLQTLICQGTDGNGLTLDYIDDISDDSTIPQSLGSVMRDNVAAYLLAGGWYRRGIREDGSVRLATPGGTWGTYFGDSTTARKNFIVSGIGTPTLAVLAHACVSMRHLAAGGSATMKGWFEHLGICASTHNGTSLNGRSGSFGGGDIDCFEIFGRTGSLSSPYSYTDDATETNSFILRHLLVWASQDELISIGRATKRVVIDNVWAFAPMCNAETSPATVYNDQSNHDYGIFVFQGAQAVFIGRVLQAGLKQRGAAWQYPTGRDTGTPVGNASNTSGVQQNCVSVATGRTTVTTLGAVAWPTDTMPSQEVNLQTNCNVALSHSGNSPYLWTDLDTTADSRVKLFVGGANFNQNRTLIDPNLSDNQVFAPTFVEKSRIPALITEQAIRDFVLSQGGANRIPQVLYDLMEDYFDTSAAPPVFALPSSNATDITRPKWVNNTAVGRGDGTPEIREGKTLYQGGASQFQADFLTPRGLAWGQKYSAENYLPKKMEIEAALRKTGSARLYTHTPAAS